MISIVIPTYEQRGHGCQSLKKLFDTISIQDCLPAIQVVVSDNSSDNRIEKLCDEFSERFTIKYVRNTVRGVSENTNNAINHADGELIKPMFMDDVFLHRSAVTQFALSLKNHFWSMSDSHHINERSLKTASVSAKFDPKTIIQFNSVGMPSVIAFRKCDVRFDVRLKTCLDTFFYLQLFKQFGHPSHINRFLIGQRIWKHSLSANQPDFKKRDMMILKQTKQLT